MQCIWETVSALAESMGQEKVANLCKKLKNTAAASLAIGMPWLALCRLFLCSFVQMSLENTSLTL